MKAIELAKKLLENPEQEVNLCVKFWYSEGDYNLYEDEKIGDVFVSVENEDDITYITFSDGI